uniref:Uncharacterized protein n=1 Tax=Anguilla anguilla TaxID=7936 RepID=A0A0E9XLI8_ANGAN
MITSQTCLVSINFRKLNVFRYMFRGLLINLSLSIGPKSVLPFYVIGCNKAQYEHGNFIVHGYF